jgi:anti-sigma regulatory factor (Ser/Thr protein kinase)
MADLEEARVFASGSSGVLREIRTFVGTSAGSRLPEGAIEDLKLAVTEAAANALRHSGSEHVRVSVVIEGGCVRVVVEDDGVYQATLRAVDGDLEGHRGFAIIAAMVDEFSVRRGTPAGSGTVVRMLKCAG